mgnify:CR=1 FL=1
MTDEVFKSVQVLKGIPVDTFFEAMGDVRQLDGQRLHLLPREGSVASIARSSPCRTPKIVRARGMILMMNAINSGCSSRVISA